MIFLPLVLILTGYQLGWYGYATLKQPVEGGCVGFMDLLLPSHLAKVDNCIQNNWSQAQQAQNANNNQAPTLAPLPNTRSANPNFLGPLQGP